MTQSSTSIDPKINEHIQMMSKTDKDVESNKSKLVKVKENEIELSNNSLSDRIKKINKNKNLHDKQIETIEEQILQIRKFYDKKYI